jgi:hypothetical protein
MRQRLNSTDLSIEELLSGRFAFTIPAYQRDFAWGRPEALQLIDDLAAVIEDVERDGARTAYFLGTMLLVEPPGVTEGDGEHPRQVEVVDGQQRLITLAIILASLRDALDGDGAAVVDALVAARTEDGERRHHLQLRSADDEFFQAAIQTPGATRRARPAGEVGQSIARGNVENVRRAVRGRLLRGMAAGERRAFLAFLRTNVRVLVVSSDDFDYAYQIFLTINDRGKRLSVEDIFRGEILGPLDADQRARYEAIIAEMEKYREQAEVTRTKGKTFFSHLATIDGWPRRGIIDGLKKAVERRGGPRRFVADVFAPMAESYLQIKGGDATRPVPDAAVPWLMRLGWLEAHGDDDWMPIAMVGLARLGDDEAAVVDLLRHLDRFAHGLMAIGCGRDARRRHYEPVLKRLLASPTVPPAELLAIAPVNQRAIMRNIASRLHYNDPPTAKLVLVRADEFVSGRPAASYAPLVMRDRLDPERYTVEHVCPKGEIADGDWLRLFPRKPLRVRAAQCIGNLALVTEAQNKNASQKDFATKKGLYLAGEAPHPFVLTEMLREEVEWDGMAIARRYNLIMSAVRQMWMLDVPIPPCPAIGRGASATD